MSRILLLFTLAFTTLFANAQKTLNEATLTYNVTVKKSETGRDVTNVSTALYKLFIKGNSSRSDFSNKMGVESTIYNSKTEKGVILKAYGAQQLMINLTKEDWIDYNKKFKSLDFTIENSSKNIGGFICKKATAILNKDESIVVYFDPEIQLSNKDFTISFANIQGLPIQFQRIYSGLTYEYTLNDINYDGVSPVTFEYPKSGYRVLTYSEAQNFKKEN